MLGRNHEGVLGDNGHVRGFPTWGPTLELVFPVLRVVRPPPADGSDKFIVKNFKKNGV